MEPPGSSSQATRPPNSVGAGTSAITARRAGMASPFFGHHADGPALSYHDLADTLPARDGPAPACQSPDHGRAELAGASLGYREPDVVAEHGEEPPVEPARGRLGRQVGVQRPTASNNGPPRPANSSLSRHTGDMAEPGEAQQVG